MKVHQLCVLAIAVSQSVAQPALLNGGFEDGDVGRDVVIPSWIVIDTPDVIGPGGLADNVGGPFTLGLGIPASPDGGQFVVLRNSPFNGLTEAVSQTLVDLDVGRTYRVSMYLSNAGLKDDRAGRSDDTGDGALVIAFGTQTVTSSVLSFGGFGSQSWLAFAHDFVAEDQEIELRLTASGFTGNTARIGVDGVSVEIGPCNVADIAVPFGVLDLDDVDEFIVGFAAGSSDVDIALPFGTLDLSDIDSFIAGFLAGCP